MAHAIHARGARWGKDIPEKLYTFTLKQLAEAK